VKDCVSCSAPVQGRYCSACGELRADLRRDGVHHFGLELFESFTHLDGKVFRSLRTLFAQPGELTRHYLRGARRPYMTPLQVFLVANLVFFLMQSWVSWNTLTTPLVAHTSMQPYSELAREHLRHFVEQHGVSLDLVRQKFDAAVVVYAKSLVLLMVPLYALGSALVCVPRPRGVLAQFVAALHLYAAFLLFQSLVLGPLALAIAKGLGADRSEIVADQVVTVLLALVMTVYNAAVLRRVFGFGRFSSLARALLLDGVFGLVLMSYRFLLFFIVLHTIDLSGR
jgi:hypothetical protein